MDTKKTARSELSKERVAKFELHTACARSCCLVIVHVPNATCTVCVHAHTQFNAKMSSKISEKKCPMCSFEAPIVKLVLSHLRSIHSNDPRFRIMCGIDGCARTYRKYSGLHSHLYRCHWSTSRGNSQSLDSLNMGTGADCMELSPQSSDDDPLKMSTMRV